VLDAQRSLFASQQLLVLLRLEKLASQIQLYAVLGGGWHTGNEAEDARFSASGTPNGK